MQNKPKVPEIKKDIDIIIMSNTISIEQKRLTENCIKTLNDKQHNYNVFIMENNKDSKYENAVTINYDFEFNYHRCVNYCIKHHCQSEFICFCNNDLIFSEGWASEILKYVPSNFLSASPWCEKSHKNIFGNMIGTEIGHIISGWCIFVHRSIFDKIGKLDERVSFWYSDNIYGVQLEAAGLEHILVYNSKVTHLGSKTLWSLSKLRQRKLTKNQLKVFNQIKDDYLNINNNELLVIPPLKAFKGSSGEIFMTKKFISGMNAYAVRWPGDVTVMLDIVASRNSNLDHMAVTPENSSFKVEFTPMQRSNIEARMRRAGVVLGGISGVKGVNQVVVKEYNFNTRVQLSKLNAHSLLRSFKAMILAVLSELKMQKNAKKLAGIQCNGIPSYNEYKRLNTNTLLFYDSRIEIFDLISKLELKQRESRLLKGAPLRLFFTGRLLKIKGVHHLPEVAKRLRQLRVNFEMHICGGGECEQQLINDIKKYSLENVVHLHGVLKFKEELLPFVKQNADIFICTHLQGDPSCTYLETMACGVPIVGYANDAWKSLSEISAAGWTSPLNDPKSLSVKIAELDKDRASITVAGNSARDFAKQHLFTDTMDRRVKHLASCLPD